MTISKERLDEITIKIAKEMPAFDLCLEPYAFHKYFAHTLLKAVESEQEVVGHGLFDTDGKCHAIGQHRSSMCIGGKAFKSKPLIALPLVYSEE